MLGLPASFFKRKFEASEKPHAKSIQGTLRPLPLSVNEYVSRCCHFFQSSTCTAHGTLWFCFFLESSLISCGILALFKGLFCLYNDTDFAGPGECYRTFTIKRLFARHKEGVKERFRQRLSNTKPFELIYYHSYNSEFHRLLRLLTSCQDVKLGFLSLQFKFTGFHFITNLFFFLYWVCIAL